MSIRLDQLLGHSHHMGQPHVASANRHEQVFLTLQPEAVNQLRIVCAVQGHTGQLALDHQLAGLHVLLAGLFLEPVLHLGPRA